MRNISPKLCFMLCNFAGFGLLAAFWLESAETAGFFLLLILIVMSLLRRRIPKLEVTAVFDIIICVALAELWPYASFAMALPLFAAMYFGRYWILLAGVAYLAFNFEPTLAAILILTALCGMLLGFWERERQGKLKSLDNSAKRYYEMANLQNDLAAALAQVERMTAVAERTRIARDIHDNAGHEIVAAYISLQTAREMMDAKAENADALELYDAAMDRLNTGANKIREAVHNLSAVTVLGVENLQEICRRFPARDVTFCAYGDTSKIPMYVWSMLESCLNECLTNVARHSAAKYVNVDLDATPHIVRLCVENDGLKGTGGNSPIGTGLRNLRHRAAAIGGNLSVDYGKAFRVICVIPMKEEQNEAVDS